jgi:hypothetical protein
MRRNANAFSPPAWQAGKSKKISLTSSPASTSGNISDPAAVDSSGSA